MTIIALISQNGDIGKSALACTLATEVARNGVETICIDLDREHRELSDWMQIRKGAGVEPVFEVMQADNAQEALSLCDDNIVTIIDCPSRATQATVLIAQNVDLVVMPVLPASRKNANLALDMFAQLINSGISPDKIVMVFSRVSTPAEITRSTQYLRESVPDNINLQILEHSLPEKAAYRMATTDGLALSETSYLTLNRKAVNAVDEIAGYLAA